MTNGDGIRTPTRAIRILGLVIESGMLYILVGVSPPPLSGTWVQARVITLFFLSLGPSFGRTFDEPAILVIYRNLVSLDRATCCA